MISIFINGESKELAKKYDLIELLEHFSLPTERIAIELNQVVVRRKDWKNIKISEGDKLEVIHFVGGG